jgi:radical SAM-linked protein
MCAAISVSTSVWRVFRVASGEFRLRVHYSKAGRLRWLSHLELIHALERSVRRAGLDYAVTQGFNPHMKVAFGPALPVGTAGDNEYYDVWLTRYTDSHEVLRSLLDSTPHDLAPIDVGYVADGEPSLGAAITIAVYRVTVTGEESTASQVRTALESLVGSGSLTVQRKGKDKVFDLTRSLPKEARVGDKDGGSEVEITVRMGAEGSLRPEVLVLQALSHASLDATVAHTTRTDTFIETSEGSWARPV